MAKKNVKYYYKEHIYVVKDWTKIKTATGWVDGVIYQRENEPNGPVYTRGAEQFDELFIPFTLNVGDKIAVITMSKMQGVLEVVRIDEQEGIAYCESGNFKINVKIDVDAEHRGILECVGWCPQASDVFYYTHAIRMEEARHDAKVKVQAALNKINSVIDKMDVPEMIQVSNILSSLVSNEIKENV